MIMNLYFGFIFHFLNFFFIINELINGFTRQYETILNLKNVEFSKIMQNRVFLLTIVVIVLAAAQIIIGIIALKRPAIIIKLLLGG